MPDGARQYPVNLFVIHHSAGIAMKGATDIVVQDWFDNIGKNRGYAGLEHSYHMHPSRNKETFAQAQIALIENNDGTWRIVELMRDIWNNVAWHCGNWEKNQRSIGVEVCGNYVGKHLPDKALLVLADFWVKKDQELGGATEIMAHGWISPTQCPGGIQDQIINPLVDMVNNNAEWHKKLDAPAEVPWNKTVHSINLLFTMKKGIPLYDLTTGAVVNTSGLEIHATKKTDVGAWPLDGVGRTMYLPKDRVDAGQMMGFCEDDLYHADNFESVDDLDYVPPVEPEPEPPTPPQFVFTVVINGDVIIYTGTDYDEALGEYTLTIPTEQNHKVQLKTNGVTQMSKNWTAPKPPEPPKESLYDALLVWFNGFITWLKEFKR